MQPRLRTAADHTLFANWTANTYTVTFDPEGGSVTPSSQDKLFGSTYGKASDGATAEVMPTPTLSGYSFAGWWTGDGRGTGTQVTDESIVSIAADHTLYAKWALATHTVTYSAGASGSLSGVSRETVADGEYPTLVPDVTPNTGYRFDGWSTDGGATLLTKAQVKARAVTKDIAYTAYYTLLTYTMAPIENQTCTPLVEGYADGSQETKTITLTRTGTGALANLRAALGGADAARFTLTQPIAGTLEDGQPSTTFTVCANDDLFHWYVHGHGDRIGGQYDGRILYRSAEDIAQNERYAQNHICDL